MNISTDQNILKAYYDGMICGSLGYRVIDNQTGCVATRAVYSLRAAASRAADRLDAKYGAYRYSIESVVLLAD